MPPLLGAGGTSADLPRETVVRLSSYVAMLMKWNPTINLVARGSLESVWTRHIQDSLQVLGFRDPRARSWLDLGSGAGLPGLVVAIALAEELPEMKVTLVEADRRKAEFLRAVSRETGIRVNIITDRIENLPFQAADVISARALAPLAGLCAHAHRHLAPGGQAIFHKGAGAAAEISEARRLWTFKLDRHPSETDPNAEILVLKDVRHV